MLKFIPGVRHQGQLENAIHTLFPNNNILVNCRKGTGIINPNTGKHLELDIWIPELKLAFEFQDDYHYKSTWYCNVPLTEVQSKDDVKIKLLESRNETLLAIPCWWDGTVESLIATIRRERPDLLKNHNTTSEPIPPSPPDGFFEETTIPDVGELMLATFYHQRAIRSLENWWMGEKWDGIRVCWHPVKHAVYARSGKIYHIPTHCSSSLPTTFIDGEIWAGRGYFPQSRPFSEISNWDYLRIVAFDKPDPIVQNLPFEQRYSQLRDDFSADHPLLTLATRISVINAKHIKKYSKQILDDAGEGVIIRKSSSGYERGRSNNLIKLKAVRADKEALVERITRNGSYLLKTANGTTFIAKLPLMWMVKRHPRKGDIVSFSYEKYSRNVIPVKPRMFRIRTDMSWDDVVKSENDPFEVNANEKLKFVQHSQGYWKSIHKENMRIFFERLAASKHRDPRVANSWYDISTMEVANMKGGKTILQYYNGSAVKALIDVFPDIGLHESKFNRSPFRYFYVKARRRKFFIDFAKDMGFDYSVPENWYNISRRDIESFKNGVTVMNFYGSLWKALVDVFPDIGLDETKFSWYFNSTENRRKFFVDLAKDMGFDHSVPGNWYNISRTTIESYKNGAIVLNYGSRFKALVDVFPDIGLDETEFKKQYFHSTEYRRKFFIDFAKEKGFDYSVPENWYNISRTDIESYKNGLTMMNFYGSLLKALTDVFPDIGLDELKFNRSPRLYFHSKEHRRKFFMDFAKEKGFDYSVPENWYNISRATIESRKNGLTVMKYYRSLFKALVDVFPNIGLDETKFSGHFNSKEHRRKFYEDFAKEKGFDYSVPENWYNISRRDIESYKNGATVMKFYGSLLQALVDVFTDIGVEETKFNRLSRRHAK